ncbi:OPT family oligopeptide transporter [Corynebacterium pseudotuberculosis]|uniref:OPT family oligopeptide transporter n=1 Tax=Corynebacterium pseudotuberculosis TaxID=1719 RepID=UPI0001DD4770|nr:oligopeptide transporter, OPT family [Corynebacterium pseudotuberculosis]ADK28019.1 oligopeptide transporter, OPT family [Corynebacterium pseudotuberculosis FRC41]ADL20129.1 oligopeptide transporter, OPT family [Corynebacterium pseudotuberculosis 1002]AIG06587.1 oligopeptide transporter [Corynebacterium pseudotuberculosis]AIG08831.1 oligopeptide transporter [Corynebacterium pseudotuberculosis]AIG10724.1 oligopeptide transporter [Corynebacterium pseudotuberculosis]
MSDTDIAKPSTGSSIRELTLRAVIIGGLITLVFTAANVYLGLKVGITFATSIPAAVISMAILRRFAGHTIQENNVVQTIASAAGTLSAIIFVLPGLIMVGWWSGFPYWTTAFVCAIGGVLGVMYSIPLRRALVTGSDLPYPEGVAAAEVLKVGNDAGNAEEYEGNKKGLAVIVWGGIASVGYSLLTAMKGVAGEVSTTFKVGAGGTMFGSSLSLALIGVGHLVGPAVGISMIVGLLISYGVLFPYFSAAPLAEGGELASVVNSTFVGEVRFVGAGAMAVAAVWTLIKIIGPIVKGIKESLASSRTRAAGGDVDLTERDIPFKLVVGTILASMLPVSALLYLFIHASEIAHHTATLVIFSIVFVLLIGLIVASVCGYMAGLIGAPNSPISGVGIIVVLASALLIKVVTGSESDTNAPALVAYTLFTSAVVFGIATISNDNLQDLKTGQLVNATPWKQQVALIIGVIFGSIIIPPVLQLMLDGFGFVGMEGAGDNALAAPQAALLSSVAEGIFGDSLNWNRIGLGAIIGVIVIIIDELLKRTKGWSLPALSVGMGIYLPIALTAIIPVGAFIGYFYDKWAKKQSNPEFSKRMGILLATGVIVGESLFGVLNAAMVGGTGMEAPLAIFGYGENVATGVGIIVFVLLVVSLYRWVRSKASE